LKIPILPRALAASCVLALAIAAAPAHAGLFRAYLSVNGNDANDCSVAHPCRLLPAALAAVNDGGEIWIVDSANFNTGAVAITKSVSILAIPGALGSLVANGGEALTVDTAGIVVALRNLSFTNLASGTYGIRYLQGQSVTVDGCRFANLPVGAILGAPSTAEFLQLFVKNSVFRANGTGVVVAGAMIAHVDRAQVVGSSGPGLAVAGGTLLVSNSVVTGSGDAGVTVGGSQTQLALERSTISNNATFGVFANSAPANVIVTRSILTGNDTGAATAVTGAALLLDDSTISNNATAGVAIFGGSVQTRGNNMFDFNGTDVTGGSLTTLAPQ
jgi:hypothetical protein